MRTVKLRMVTNPDSCSRGIHMPMPRSLLSILSFAIFGTLSATQANAGRAGDVKFATEVPLLDCDGMPCVEARMGSGPNLKMGIDTGNVGSVLDVPYAEAAGLKPTEPLPAGAPSGMYRTTIPSISVGHVTLTNVET